MTKKEKTTDKSLLGIWSFDKKAIEDMKNLTEKSKYDKIEHGGLLCFDLKTKKINLQKQCTGYKCEIEIPKSCEKGTYYAGFFHTHPLEEKHDLSISDIINYNKYNDYIGCLGLPEAKRNKVMCHTNKSNSDKYWKEKSKETSKLEKMSIIEEKIYWSEDSKGDYEKYIKYLKKYQNKFLTKFNPEDYIAKD